MMVIKSQDFSSSHFFYKEEKNLGNKTICEPLGLCMENISKENNCLTASQQASYEQLKNLVCNIYTKFHFFLKKERYLMTKPNNYLELEVN
jgi:hypothetical protein